VSLRGFDQFDRKRPPLLIDGVPIGADLKEVISRAAKGAGRVANTADPGVFAPPIATFQDAKRARTADLANGLAISVEIDAGSPEMARLRLEAILGPVTIACRSGGDWIDDRTGEVHPKMHLHWRLSEPTREPVDHQLLQDARWLAAVLVGADRSAAPSAHPLRWPDSWNRKAHPRLSEIAHENEQAEVHLVEALERLQEAVEAAGLGRPMPGAAKSSSEPQADMALVESALQAIPNLDETWDEWNRIGMAAYSASGGSEAGLDAWCEWSAKSNKHEDAACVVRWDHFAGSPPSRIGAGTIFFLARQAGWQDPRRPKNPEPPPHDEVPPGPEPDTATDDPANEPQDRIIPGLADALSVDTWASLDIPPDRRLLGAVVTSASRVFLVGATGLGKTLLAYAMAAGMAIGQGFLGWRCDGPSRVLIIDGEMPSGLIKSRVADVLRRAGPIPPRNLSIYSRDRAEEVASIFPRLGAMEPLNTDAGRSFVLSLIDAIGGVDCVVLDNVMALIIGDMKDEIPWSETLALVSALSTRGIAQIWLDHSGHNTARQYGSSTKAWRFDAVGVMTPIEGESGVGSSVAFKLSFEPPGKARRRTPDNWEEFKTATIRLEDDQWTSDTAKPPPQKISPRNRLYHSALRDALASAQSTTQGRTSRAAWMAECVRRNLIVAAVPGDTGKERDRKANPFRKAVTVLLAARWIGADGDTFTDLTA